MKAEGRWKGQERLKGQDLCLKSFTTAVPSSEVTGDPKECNGTKASGASFGNDYSGIQESPGSCRFRKYFVFYTISSTPTDRRHRMSPPEDKALHATLVWEIWKTREFLPSRPFGTDWQHFTPRSMLDERGLGRSSK